MPGGHSPLHQFGAAKRRRSEENGSAWLQPGEIRLRATSRHNGNPWEDDRHDQQREALALFDSPADRNMDGRHNRTQQPASHGR